MAPFVVFWDMIKLCCKSIYDCKSYIRDLEVKTVSLSAGKRQLECNYNYVRGRVEGAKEAHEYVPRDPVLGWLERTKETISKVDSILQRGEKEKAKQCLGCYCSKNYLSGENISNEVAEEIQTVSDLIGSGNFEVVADPPPQPVVENLPTQTTVGLESRLRDVWTYIEDDSVKIIGMYGVRGVGKTTLLEQLHKKFQDTTHNFDVVIYVKASTELNIAEIQKVIRYRLEITDDTWTDKNEQGRATEISRRLIKKKFALLLDDIREPIKVSKAGVPVQNGSKIVFTTILEDVCYKMRAEKTYKVDYLSQKDARDLFRRMVTDDVLNYHPAIPKLAEIVADMCGGLPLALTAIGSSPMFRIRDPGTWQHAIDVLQCFPSEFPGMGNRIFPRLKFSYDSLSTTQKTCFLFCSLFPRNKYITEDELIELWIGEGILSYFYDNIAAARRHGKYIIESLKLACLLEEVKGGNLIRMHDMLREMALWIAFQDNKKILVLEADDMLIKEQRISNWNGAERVSLWKSPIESDSPTPPSCPGLLTLLIRGTDVEEFPNQFFQSMPDLRVLDYSQNRSLTKFPVLNGELTDLRYLNLSNTRISELPMEMQRFAQMRILLLDGTKQLKAIPEGLLSNFLLLQVFSWQPTIVLYSWLSIAEQVSSFPGATVTLLKELASLKHIQEISIVLSTLDSITVFKSSHTLQTWIRRLIIDSPEFHSSDIFSTRKQKNGGCFQKLQVLSIIKCPVKDLTSLIHVPSLQLLLISACHSLEEIIAYDDVDENNMFSNLKIVHFEFLPNVRSICRKAMPFPSLESIYVRSCPSLRKLPFNSESAKKITVVIGEKEWWNQLEWENEATKQFFGSKFARSRYQPTVSTELDPTACSIM